MIAAGCGVTQEKTIIGYWKVTALDIEGVVKFDDKKESWYFEGIGYVEPIEYYLDNDTLITEDRKFILEFILQCKYRY